MDSSLPFSFSNFPEDVQIRILSFLNPRELESLARISTRFLALCRDDERLWYLKCSRRWGSHTQIKKWKISYRLLYHFLENYENLIGFWQTEPYSTMSPPQSPSSMALFEWGSFYITGYRILLSKHGVTKKPFLWITATSDGKAMSYLDTDGRFSLTEKDLLKEDSEKLRGGGLILVNVTFCGDEFLGLGEIPEYFEFRRRSSTLVEYENESVYRSPPDELMTQIHRTLANKISVTGGDPTSRRARKKGRQREREKWRRVPGWARQSFRKITECCPTPFRPLQGLWKGMGPDGSLNLYLVCYREEWNIILCEKVEGSSTELEAYRDIVFTASYTAFIESPYSAEEESMYNSRVHLRQANQAGHIDVISSDVLRIFYVHSDYNPYPSENSDDADGRIWIYADGTFGFGFLRDDCIVDLKPMTKNGCLLDIMM
ncbi:F-box protein At3g12350-like [Henckelia pumila]|uniref:F-box protein At3g12350-like n=1 Tax=Henckelia pumila TaxID=405737 RepID=UPI003C6DC30B